MVVDSVEDLRKENALLFRACISFLDEMQKMREHMMRHKCPGGRPVNSMSVVYENEIRNLIQAKGDS